MGAQGIACTQNATSGEEFRRGWHAEKFERAGNAEKDVLVVGAGPSGMECAMVLGKREMNRVHLVDAGAVLGGSMRWIPKLPGLGEWARVVNYHQIQIEKLTNVDFIPKTRLESQASVLDYGAEIVVVATGSRWATDGLQGITNEPIPGADASLPHVATPDQIMAEGKSVGKQVVVYDCETYFTGVGIAEKLVREGHDVTYVTPFDAIAPYTVYTLEFPRLNRTLRRLGVKIVTGHVMTNVALGNTTIAEAWLEEESELECDTVVLVTQRVSDDALYRELSAGPGGAGGHGHHRSLPDRRLRPPVAHR